MAQPLSSGAFSDRPDQISIRLADPQSQSVSPEVRAKFCGSQRDAELLLLLFLLAWKETSREQLFHRGGTGTYLELYLIQLLAFLSLKERELSRAYS